MNWKELKDQYNKLQTKYGDKNLDAIISGGKKKNPDICFIFMNPTGRNIASDKNWKGLKAPWIGPKTVWKVFLHIRIFGKWMYNQIQRRKPQDWDVEFAEKVYREVEKNNFYITNLAKCTQLDSRKLPDAIFRKYRKLLVSELELVKPKKIITFGNQVSSVFLKRSISVSTHRRTIFEVEINGKKIPTLPTYYPVGQGQRNMDKAVRDIRWYISNN
jgi:DNA polymerase